MRKYIGGKLGIYLLDSMTVPERGRWNLGTFFLPDRTLHGDDIPDLGPFVVVTKSPSPMYVDCQRGISRRNCGGRYDGIIVTGKAEDRLL